VARCYIFKPDGIGDFFLATGFIRLMAREFGEEKLVISVLPPLEDLVRGQFPAASVITLPLRKKRVFLNVFVANCLRCFQPWMRLLFLRVEIAVSLRNMRDYLQNVLFHSVRARRRFVAVNGLLGNGKAVRRLTEKVFVNLFGDDVTVYPEQGECPIPLELESHRRLASRILEREVSAGEVWPLLHSCGEPPVRGEYSLCAPYSSGNDKDVPDDRWMGVFHTLAGEGRLGPLVLTGSPDQGERLMRFAEALSGVHPHPVSVITASGLQGFVDLIAGAAMVYTVDTAAAHASTALDRRTLVLFSGLHCGMFAPWTRSNRQCWLLAGIPDSGPAWHESLSDREILEACRRIQDTF
jgi:Glycosyltransferase family 9 (heptosyltransferase)